MRVHQAPKGIGVMLLATDTPKRYHFMPSQPCLQFTGIHSLTSLGADWVVAVWRENGEWGGGHGEKVDDEKAPFSCPVKETSITDARIHGTLTLTVMMESSDYQLLLMFYCVHVWGN